MTWRSILLLALCASALAAGAAEVAGLVRQLATDDGPAFMMAVEALGQAGKAAVPALAGAVKSPDWRVRAGAALALGRLKDPAGVAPLAGLRQEKNDYVLLAVAQALGQINDPQAIDPLLRLLQGSNSPSVRFLAAQAVGKFTEPRVSEALLAALQDPASKRMITMVVKTGPRTLWLPGEMIIADIFTETRVCDPLVSIARALAATGDAKAVPALTAAFAASSGATQQELGMVLGRLGASSLEPLLAAWQAQQDPERRKPLLLALAETRDPRALPALKEGLLTTKDTRLRMALGDALVTFGQPAVPVLVEGLRSSDQQVQHVAVDALTALGAPALPPVVPLLTEGGIISHYARQVFINNSAPVVPTLVEALKSPDPGVRQSVAAMLAYLGDERTTDALLALLQDPKPEVQYAALLGLAGTRDPRAAETLEGMLKAPDPKVRKAAAEALGNTRALHAVEVLQAAIADEDPQVGAAAVRALGSIGEAHKGEKALEPIVDQLIAGLWHPAPAVRAECPAALGKIASPKAVEALIANFPDQQDALLRINTVTALGKVGDARAIPVLIGALKDKERMVRYWTALALGNLAEAKAEGIGAAVAPLLPLLQDPEQVVRMGAGEGLLKIGRSRMAVAEMRTAVEALAKAAQAGGAQPPTEAARALGATDDPKAYDILLTMCNAGDSRASALGVRGLGETRDPRAYDVLLAKLTTAEPMTAACAAEALGMLKDARAVEPLLTMLKTHPNGSARAGACQGLAALGDPRAIDPLIAALKDPWGDDGHFAWGYVRRAAAEALGTFKDPRVVLPLIGALRDPAPLVRLNAQKALVTATGQDFRMDAERWAAWWEKEGTQEK